MTASMEKLKKIGSTSLSGRVTISPKTAKPCHRDQKSAQLRDKHCNNRTTRTEGLIGAQNSRKMQEMAFYFGNVG